MSNSLNQKQTVKPWQADMMLVVITMCWGISYMLMDLSLEDMNPCTLNAHRFLIGSLVTLVLGFKRVKNNFNKTTLKWSILVGCALVCTYMCATYGVKYTTISNSGFLCAMTVVFTPLISIVVLRQKQEPKAIGAVILSFIGIALLTLNEDFSINMENLKGDLLCLGCGFFYAVDLLITEKAVSHKEVDAYTMGVFQLATVGVINLIVSFAIETPHLPTEPKYWGSTLFLAVFCTGLAFVLQPIAQQYTTAARTGVIFTLEPVFNAFVAVIFVHEILSFKSYLGGFIMVFAIVFMEVDFKALLRGKKTESVSSGEENPETERPAGTDKSGENERPAGTDKSE